MQLTITVKIVDAINFFIVTQTMVYGVQLSYKLHIAFLHGLQMNFKS